MNIRKVVGLILIQFIIITLLSGCSASKTVTKKGTPAPVIVLADADWISIRMHNRIAGYIIEHGYGYTPNYLTGENIPLLRALEQGDVDVVMEVWTTDYSTLWEDMLKGGQVKAVSTNYTGKEGWFIPAYLVVGDKERGIEPLIPNFKSVNDLPAYQKYFKLSATSSQGIIFNAPSEWPEANTNMEKLNGYNLSPSFSLLPGDSESGTVKNLEHIFDRGDAWLGFARDPSAITVSHNMILVRERPFTDEEWQLGRTCAYPECPVMIAVNTGMNQKAPELLDFLQKYTTTRDQNVQMLLYEKKSNGNREQAAEEWLRNNPDVWRKWVSEPIANKIWADLNPAPPTKTKNSLWQKLIKRF